MQCWNRIDVHHGRGYTFAQGVDIKGAEERVADKNICVEEAERLAGLDGLDPEGNTLEFYSHWVTVCAVDATDGIAKRVAVVGCRGKPPVLARASRGRWGELRPERLYTPDISADRVVD